jgi:hypothetical protein
LYPRAHSAQYAAADAALTSLLYKWPSSNARAAPHEKAKRTQQKNSLINLVGVQCSLPLSILAFCSLSAAVGVYAYPENREHTPLNISTAGFEFC